MREELRCGVHPSNERSQVLAPAFTSSVVAACRYIFVCRFLKSSVAAACIHVFSLSLTFLYHVSICCGHVEGSHAFFVDGVNVRTTCKQDFKILHRANQGSAM